MIRHFRIVFIRRRSLWKDINELFVFPPRMRINFACCVEKSLSSRFIFSSIECRIVLLLHYYLLNIFIFYFKFYWVIEVYFRYLRSSFFKFLWFVVNLYWRRMLLKGWVVAILKDIQQLVNTFLFFDFFDFFHVPTYSNQWRNLERKKQFVFAVPKPDIAIYWDR